MELYNGIAPFLSRDWRPGLLSVLPTGRRKDLLIGRLDDWSICRLGDWNVFDFGFRICLEFGA
jgi:hypothetical protein